MHLSTYKSPHKVSKTHYTAEEFLLILHSISLSIATVLGQKKKHAKGYTLSTVNFDCMPPRLCPTIRSS